MRRLALVLAAFLASQDALAQTGVGTFPIGSAGSGIFGKAAISGPVTNAGKAIAVARPVLISVYGKQAIQREEPLIASRKGDVWFIEGTLECPDKRAWWEKVFRAAPVCLGGAAALELSATTGAVLLVTHYQ